MPEGHWLVASLTGGRAALFYTLVLLHAAAALVGFGSIGFGGTYASRAYLPSDRSRPGAPEPASGPSTAMEVAEREAERIRFARAATLAARGAACCDVLFFVALALMIWQP